MLLDLFDNNYIICTIILCIIIFILEVSILISGFIKNKCIRLINYNTLLGISVIIIITNVMFIQTIPWESKETLNSSALPLETSTDKSVIGFPGIDEYSEYSIGVIVFETLFAINTIFIIISNSGKTTNIVMPYNNNTKLKNFATTMIQAQYRGYKCRVNYKENNIILEVINDGII